MRAQVGDRICVNSAQVSQPPRLGTVLEVRPGVKTPHYMVEWDDGTTSMFMPSGGSTIRLEGPRGAEHPASQMAPPSADAEERFACHIEVRMTETIDGCEATAMLMTPRGSFSATGRSRRHPEDPIVPMIGEELAMGRALTRLGNALSTAAMDAVAAHEDRNIHLLTEA